MFNQSLRRLLLLLLLLLQAIWIVSELCPRGSLRQVLDDRGTPLAPRARLRVAVDVAEGMLYLHSREEPSYTAT